MFDRRPDVFAAALLLVFLLPLIAWHTIRAGWRSWTKIFHRTQTDKLAGLKQLIASEFHFERAIEAYEELIDSTYAEDRP